MWDGTMQAQWPIAGEGWAHWFHQWLVYGILLMETLSKSTVCRIFHMFFTVNQLNTSMLIHTLSKNCSLVIPCQFWYSCILLICLAISFFALHIVLSIRSRSNLLSHGHDLMCTEVLLFYMYFLLFFILHFMFFWLFDFVSFTAIFSI